MSDDPVRWRDAAEPPAGALELVRSLEGPPPLPPDLRASVRARVRRTTVPKTRWLTPTTLAVAAVIGGLVIWRFAGPSEPSPAPITPDVEAVLDDAIGAGTPEANTDAGGEANTRAGGEANTERSESEDPTPHGARDADGETQAAAPGTAETPSRPPTQPTRATPGLAGEETETAAASERPDRDRRRASPRARPAPPPRVDRFVVDTVQYGTITINTMPWARVYIDGEYIGNTPVRRHRLTAGVHELVLDSPEAGRHEMRIHIEPAADLRLVRQL